MADVIRNTVILFQHYIFLVLRSVYRSFIGNCVQITKQYKQFHFNISTVIFMKLSRFTLSYLYLFPSSEQNRMQEVKGESNNGQDVPLCVALGVGNAPYCDCGITRSPT